MLSQLYINHVAVISEATIEFEGGLNVFTGETGAGKTILIHAINAVLGERVSRDLIRTGESRAVITALFTDLSNAAQEALVQAGYPAEDASVLIYREISADGKSNCKIDGRPATASILKSISEYLLNIHGQHDNQQLLSSQKHVAFIDSFGELEDLAGRCRAAYHRYMDVRRELEDIQTDEAEKARRIDLLHYQIGEIEAANLQPDEEDELKSQRKMIQNSLRITQALGGSASLLDGEGESQGIIDQLGELVANMSEAAEYLDAARPTADRLTEISYEFEGFASDIHSLLDNLDCDPSQLDEIERRLDTIYSLKKKYGATIAQILAYHEKACNELEQTESSDARAKQLTEQAGRLLEEAVSLADELFQKREAAASGFIKTVQDELTFLDMPSVKLSVRHQKKPLSADGIDDLELFISTNVGEDAKSLAKIASGGELSRIMLSIKNVLAAKDDIGTLIFDEVDTGVSGHAARKIGQKLAQVAANRQVIVVTHLAQVASFANRHLLISKNTHDGRTFTVITPLGREQRIRELARMTGGDDASEIALKHAEEMLTDAGN
ncbi:MAG: DNA repair protein RecN [Ruminococcaceae bacterium]|nr:DNA repair protein RecN [Oscillospiraceae bacterium]